MEQFVKSNAPRPERPYPHVPLPTMHVLGLEELLDGEMIKTDVLKEHFKQEGRITEEAAKYIITKATLLFRSKQNIVKIKSPAVIVGDLHGQFLDLLTIFERAGMPPDTRFVFLGDYVDRGVFGCEVLLYLYALKINFPHKVVLLRGNHECRTMTSAFNFRLEAQKKYSRNTYLRFLKSFRALQLCAIIGRHFFCVHGGLSPYLPTLKAILKLDRAVEPEDSAALSDLLWADPRVDPAHRVREFVPNTARRTSYFYGRLAAENFLSANGLLTIVRGHEVKEEGFEVAAPSPARRAPVVITVFSAPNYVGAYGNRAAFLRVDGEQVSVRQFRDAPHPYQLPNFQNVFEWSLPFVVENLAQLSLAVLGDAAAPAPVPVHAAQRREILRAMHWKLAAAAPEAAAERSTSPISGMSSERLRSFLSFKASSTHDREEQQAALIGLGHSLIRDAEAESLISSVKNVGSFLTKKTFGKVLEYDRGSEAYPVTEQSH